MSLPAGSFDQRVTIEQLVVTRNVDTGAELRTWSALCTVWANVAEFTNTGATEEYMRDGMEVHGAISRIRMRWRADVDTTMRINLGGGVLRQIVGKAMMGLREGLELSCREWTHE